MPADASMLLPWTLLAGTYCALYERSDALPEPQGQDDDPPLIAHVRQALRDVNNPMFQSERERPWPAGLDVKVHTWTNAVSPEHFILTPSALLLRHPFKNGMAWPGVSSLDKRPDVAFDSQPFLKALDYLVDSNEGRGTISTATGTPQSDADVRAAILARIAPQGQRPAGVPQGWTVSVHHDRPTIATAFSWNGNTLHVDLGWTRQPKTKGLPLMIAEWPCDPLKATSAGGWEQA